MIKLRKIHISSEIPLISIEGEVKSCTENGVLISCGDEKSTWPLIDNRFRGYVHVKNATNAVSVSCSGRTSRLTATYTPMKKTSQVALIYVTCEQDRTDVQMVNTSKKKIALLALLAQYFFANTTSRKSTFALKLNRDKVPLVQELIVKEPLEKLQVMSQEELWQFIAQQLLSSPLYSSSDKYLAVTSFDCISGEGRKIALSAGGLSLIGCYILDAMCISEPSELSNFLNAQNSHAISNCIGCCVHELAHMFDLGHCSQGIMSGDLESVGSFFLDGKKSRFWSPSSSQMLSRHRYLNRPPPAQAAGMTPFAYANGIIKSQHGILVVEWRDPASGLVLDHLVNTLPSKIMRVNQGQTGQDDAGQDSCTLKSREIVVMDLLGNMFKATLNNSTWSFLQTLHRNEGEGRVFLSFINWKNTR